MNKYKSSKKYYYFYRFGFAVISVFLLIIMTFLIGFKSTIEINGETQIAELSNSWLIFLIAGILLILHFILSSKASYVKINDDNITIQSGKTILETNLSEIESIAQIPNIVPPLYKLKIKGSRKVYLFIINSLYIEFSGFVKDCSAMGKFLKEK